MLSFPYAGFLSHPPFLPASSANRALRRVDGVGKGNDSKRAGRRGQQKRKEIEGGKRKCLKSNTKR